MSALPPIADNCWATVGCPLCANSGLMRCSNDALIGSRRRRVPGDRDYFFNQDFSQHTRAPKQFFPPQNRIPVFVTVITFWMSV